MSSTSAAPDDLGIVTGEAVALEVRSTSWVLRAAGAMIDVARRGRAVPRAAVRHQPADDHATHADGALGTALVVVDVVVSFIIAPAVLETALRGRSLGKLAVGARVVRDDGGSIGFRHAFIRSLVGIVELVFTLGSIAAVVGLLNRRAKRLGDLLAGTVSQHERVPRPPMNTLGVPATARGVGAHRGCRAAARSPRPPHHVVPRAGPADDAGEPGAARARARRRARPRSSPRPSTPTRSCCSPPWSRSAATASSRR